ncbi:hypothetical protein C8J56DRAFT_957315, partial [Mycena floridula]
MKNPIKRLFKRRLRRRTDLLSEPVPLPSPYISAFINDVEPADEEVPPPRDENNEFPDEVIQEDDVRFRAASDTIFQFNDDIIPDNDESGPTPPTYPNGQPTEDIIRDHESDDLMHLNGLGASLTTTVKGSTISHVGRDVLSHNGVTNYKFVLFNGKGVLAASASGAAVSMWRQPSSPQPHITNQPVNTAIQLWHPYSCHTNIIMTQTSLLVLILLNVLSLLRKPRLP